MTSQVKKAIRKIEELPEKEQEEIANLILEELRWNRTFESSQEQLAILAKEATKEYQSGKTNDQNWS